MKWPFLGVFSVGFSLLAACGGFRPGDAGDSADADAARTAADPYVAFTQAVSAVEPLIDPGLESLTTADQQALAGDPTSQAAVQLPAITPLEVDRNFGVVTAPELLSLNEHVYRRFIQSGYSGVMDLNAMDVRTAIQQFCQSGGADLLTINRPMTAAERASCEATGKQPMSFALARDALVLVVNQDDEFVRGVTTEKLKQILTRETWSAVDASWPDTPIERGLIGPDSAAIALLAETLFANNPTPLLNIPNTTFYDYAEPMAQALNLTPHSVGVVNYSIFQQLPQIFRAVPLNGISASFETVESGAYPLRLTSYLYADGGQMQGRSPLSAVVNFYLTHIQEATSEVALLPLTPAQLNAAKRQWLAVRGLEP